MNRAPEIRRAVERGEIHTTWLEGYCSFSFGPWQRADRDRFGALRVLNEDWVAPSSGFAMHPHADLEILLMPLQSVTAHEDSLGNVVNVRPDELLLMHAGRGIRHSQMNASSIERDHHLQLWFLPRRRGAQPALSHHRFQPTDRRDRWQLWVSGFGETDAPAFDVNARVYRANLQPGESLGAPQTNPHSAYLHVGTGSIEIVAGNTPQQLAAGDALAWLEAGRLHVRALDGAELLYVEQGPLSP